MMTEYDIHGEGDVLFQMMNSTLSDDMKKNGEYVMEIDWETGIVSFVIRLSGRVTKEELKQMGLTP